MSPARRSALRRRLAIAALIAPFVGPVRGQDEPARVAAASDLQFALPEVVAAFHAVRAQRVQLSFGSSGNFARQILQGAPFDLFLSADEAFALRLADAGLTRDRGAPYALGHIALIVPAASTLALDTRLEGLKRDWAQVQRFAIANPELAPYGRAAREALQRLGLWNLAQAKLVLGENISQATQFVSTGAAQAGIVSLSLAIAPAVAASTRHLALPRVLHEPLRQRMVLLKNARPAAVAFHDFVIGSEGQAILARHGFARPEA
jgi:molybdate transport system substrate-binding protein